jgi:lipopolysaccharide biosynthesis glycosyltransferase
MVIALAGDDAYARHIGALACSLLENRSGRYPIDIFILSKDISARNRGYLSDVCSRYGSRLTFLSVDPDVFADAPVPAHYSDVNYYRLLLPALLDPGMGKVLYLDADIIVRAPLDDVWETDVTDVALCAVRDGKRLPEHGQRGTREDPVPFNSGVLLLNLDYWRARHVLDDVLRFIRQPENHGVLRYVDQDALNAVVQDQWWPLPLVFNVQPFVFGPNRRTIFA